MFNKPSPHDDQAMAGWSLKILAVVIAVAVAIAVSAGLITSLTTLGGADRAVEASRTQITDTFSGNLRLWTQNGGIWSINAGQLEAVRSGAVNQTGFLRHNTALLSANHRVSARIKRAGTSGTNEAGLFCRSNADQTEFYRGLLKRVGDNLYRLEISALVGGKSPTLATSEAFTLTDAQYANRGVEMTLEADGNSIRLFLTNPSVRLSVTDSSIPRRPRNTQVGITARLFSGVQNRWDNFLAADLAAPSEEPEPTATPDPAAAPTPVPDTPPEEEPVEGPGGVVFYEGSPFTYVTNPRTDMVRVFDSAGTLVNQWGGPGSGQGQFNDPSGIAINYDNGLVYVADTGNHRVQMFDTGGGFISQWGGEGDGRGQFNSPSGIAINPDSGLVYVSDTENDRVQVFNLNGGFMTQWGASGKGDGELREPTGIAFNTLDGKVYVVDSGNHRVQVFLSVGLYDSQWGEKGSENGRLLSPGGILVHPVSGASYVADTGNHRIQVFDQLGEYLFGWGSEGGGESQFRNPVGVSADPASGRIYVADTGNQRIQVFSQGGTFAFGWRP